MNKNLIVSSADNKYSQLLIELYNSIEKIKGFDFAVLDCGLSESSKSFLNKKGINCKIPDWEFQIPNYKVRGRDYLKIQFSRFFLDKYFPGYENYIWMDSDTWINCPVTFQYYIKGAAQRGFAICPQVDR